jgi:MFS family permease
MVSFKERVLNHFSQTKVARDPRAIEADRWFAFPPSYYINEKINGQGGQVCRVPFNRWVLMPAAVIIQMCVGTFYAWSGYNAPIDLYITGNNAAGLAPNTFYIAVAFFGPCAAVLGPWMERNGPRSGVFLGGLGYYLGQLIGAGAIFAKQMWLLYVGYGVIGGCGLGLSYISPVSPLQKWFPDWRGLASGLAVCGFGAGSIVAPYAQNALISAYGGNPAYSMMILGTCYFVIMCVCGLTLRVPPPGYAVRGMTVDTIKGAESLQAQASAAVANVANTPVGELPQVDAAGNPIVAVNPDGTPLTDVKIDGEKAILDGGAQVASAAPAAATITSPLDILNRMNIVDAATTLDYRLMYVMMFGNLFLGLTTISKLQNMVTNQFCTDFYSLDWSTTPPPKPTGCHSASEAATINAVNSVFNLGGRVAVSLVSDKIGRKTTFLFTLGVQVILTIFLPIIFTNQVYWAFLMAIFIIAAAYGAGFGVIPAFLADMFGAKNVGALHGIILTTWSIGGVVGAIVYNTIVNANVASYYGGSTCAFSLQGMLTKL